MHDSGGPRGTASRDEVLCAVEGDLSSGTVGVEITLTVPKSLEIIGDLTTTYGDNLLVDAHNVPVRYR